MLATSVSCFPNIPVIDGIDNFKGPVLHSSAFKAGREWDGRSVVVFGTGTSAHDICQELEASGARVTMVQRSPTMVVNVEPAQIYDRTYLGDGPPIEVRDIINSGVPLPVMKVAHKLVTAEVKALDAPLHARLERAGFARRERDPEDRRKVSVFANPVVFERIAPLFEPMHRAALTAVAPYSDKELALLLDFFTRVRETSLGAMTELRNAVPMTARRQRSRGRR